MGERPSLEQFATFCERVLTTEDGEPLVLHDFQRTMLGDLFDGVRETVVLVSKKNGKSTLLGALALFHLCTTPDAECVVAAASRDQAGIMLRQAQGFIRRSPALQKRLRVKQREIVHDGLNGRIRILASDVDTVDGVIPTLALVDELHRHKTSDLYGVFRDGLGPRDGQLVTISTAGDDENSPLGVLRKAAYEQPGMVRDGAYRYVRTPGFAMHEWALDPEQDRDDLEIVKTANPAPWQTIEELRERHDSPSTVPWQWARFACGVWMAGEDSAISDKEWRACAREGLRIPDGVTGVYVGVDLGWKWDSTAIVPIWKPDDSDMVHVHPPTIIKAPGDNTSTDVEDIQEPLQQMAERWPEITFVLDPQAGGEQLAQWIDSELRARVATHSQNHGPMTLAAQRLSEAIATQKIEHPDDEALNAHVLAAAAKSVGEGWRFVKPRRKNMQIDGVIALAMAYSTLVGAPPEPPSTVYIAGM